MSHKINELEVLSGGRLFRAEYLDTDVEHSPVLVRYISIRELPKLDELESDEAALVEFYCKQPNGWADLLTPDSFEKILAIGNELNFPIRDRWLDRQYRLSEKRVGQLERMLATLPENLRGMAKGELEKLQRQLLVKSALRSPSVESSPRNEPPTSAPVSPSSSTGT